MTELEKELLETVKLQKMIYIKELTEISSEFKVKLTSISSEFKVKLTSIKEDYNKQLNEAMSINGKQARALSTQIATLKKYEDGLKITLDKESLKFLTTQLTNLETRLNELEEADKDLTTQLNNIRKRL